MVVPTRLIEASIEVPPVVEVPKGAKSLEVAVRTELANTSENDVVLHAPDEDRELFWQVLDERHREILREMVKRPGRDLPKGVQPVRSLTIAAGHSEHETETLLLNAAKMKSGGTYTVRAEIFGQITEAEFVAIETVPLTPLRPAKKAAKKKPAAKKKAAAKKKPPAKKASAKTRPAASKRAPRRAGGKKPAARNAAAKKKPPAGK